MAYEGDEVVWSRGVIQDGVPLVDVAEDDLWRLGDTLFGADGEEVHMFWEAASYESELLPGPTSFDVTDPDYVDTHVFRIFDAPGIDPDRVTARLRMRPMGLDVLGDLVESGDLDEDLLDAVPTWDLGGSAVEWVKPETDK